MSWEAFWAALVRFIESLGFTKATTTTTPPPATTTTTPKPSGTTWKAHTLTGSARKLWLPADLDFQIALTPIGPNRNGKGLRWTGTTQHETGNERSDAGAWMHSRWQDAGTPGHPDGYVGVHFYVDDRVVIQKIPVNEQGIHSGDWRNEQHTAVERCVNAGSDFRKSERAAICLQAGLLRIMGGTATEHLYPHRTKPGPGCPVYIGDHWSAFESEVDRIRRAIPT